MNYYSVAKRYDLNEPEFIRQNKAKRIRKEDARIGEDVARTSHKDCLR
jgi:hypothetical protein